MTYRKHFPLWMAMISLLGVTAAQAADLPAGAPTGAPVDQAGRELQRLQQDINRYESKQEAERLQNLKGTQAPSAKDASPQVPQGFGFVLKEIDHNTSEILSDEEIQGIVKPFIGEKLDINGLKSLLNAINQRYRDKGYIVCEARLKPQRIHDGKLFITLIEGKTGEVEVTGAKHTREWWIKHQFDLEPGKVASYRELSEDLVWFNMTNDVELRVDLHAGKAPETTDYTISANEPNNWTATVFADTLGTNSTGRARVGASVTNRSLLGLRDNLMLFGMYSQGSKSGLLSYSVPLNSTGTRVSASASVGKIKVISGPSAAMEVTGDSRYYTLRVDQPLYVVNTQKWTLYGNWTQQQSQTYMFDVKMNDTTINTYTAGIEGILFGTGSVFYVTTGINRSFAEEKTFDRELRNTYWTGNAFYRWNFYPKYTLTVSGAWQALLNGKELSSSQQMYLGHNGGVRGYPNDVISGQQGAYLNTEVSREIFGPKTAIFGFVDAGRVGRSAVYDKTTLASAGLGFKWPLWNDASLTTTAAFPFVRDIDAGMTIPRARFDVSVTAVW